MYISFFTDKEKLYLDILYMARRTKSLKPKGYPSPVDLTSLYNTVVSTLYNCLFKYEFQGVSLYFAKSQILYCEEFLQSSWLKGLG